MGLNLPLAGEPSENKYLALEAEFARRSAAPGRPTTPSSRNAHVALYICLDLVLLKESW